MNDLSEVGCITSTKTTSFRQNIKFAANDQQFFLFLLLLYHLHTLRTVPPNTDGGALCIFAWFMTVRESRSQRAIEIHWRLLGVTRHSSEATLMTMYGFFIVLMFSYLS